MRSLGTLTGSVSGGRYPLSLPPQYLHQDTIDVIKLNQLSATNW
jgi:hypothetical protein